MVEEFTSETNCSEKADYFTSSPDLYSVLKENARKNRKKMTEAESVLWEYLRRWPRPYRFRRQHIIGDYIVDFACLAANLVVEVDGGYHFTDKQIALDEIRSEYLAAQGFRIVRFSNEQVISEPDIVIDKIKEAIYTESKNI